MKKHFIIYILAHLILTAAVSAADFYSLSAAKINGDTLDFADLKGKKLMIVNTASLCGYTYQYGELQQLYDIYGGENFEIIGFPANNFGNQEPGSNEDIEDFCKANYGVTFTMMEKISVLDPDKHPVYQWLTKKALNGVQDSKVQWNFQKYLINADGTYHKVIGSQTSPLAQTIKDWLNEPVSVENTLENDKLLINILDNNLNIQTPTSIEEVINIEIYNIYGDQIYFSDNSNNYSNEIILNVGDLMSGKYFVLIRSLDKVLSGSFTIINRKM
jgi:glutathione peroxidase